MEKKHQIFGFLERLAPLIPIAFYWFDRNGIMLGGNELCARISGARSMEMFVGKKYSDVHSPEIAAEIEGNLRLVVESGKTIETEEVINDLTTNKIRYYLTIRSPLHDESNVVIGIVATTVEVTDKKEAEHLRLETELQKVKLQEQERFKKLMDQAAYDVKSPLTILLVLAQHCMGFTKKEAFETIERFAVNAPISLYWFDENNALFGANEQDVGLVGATSVTSYIGKTPYDYFPFEMADKAVKHNNLAMQAGKILSQEETIKDITTGEIKYLNAFKVPLYERGGKSIGILCASVDITAEKNAEHLKIETELQKAKLEEQEQFRKIANQVVHDIRSPLASLLMIVKSCEEDIPERARIALREAATGIGDIANNLLCKYEKDDSKVSETEEHQPIMVSLTLLQLLSEKKHQYEKLPIKFTHDLCQKCNFAFIKAEFTHFKRMMSNLINNAVDALDEKEGKISLKLNVDDKRVKIAIQDNGKGMPREVIDKIMNNIAVTADKKYGHGIGFVQISETLQRNQGKLEINSKTGKGTEITLTFPVVAPPDWIAEKIKLNKGDTVIILDDDSSIHSAWEERFKEHKNEVNLKHFTLGEEAINFINNFPEKEKIFLLADFELLKQELNGIHVIEQTKIKRSVLVTSHYTNLVVRSLAIKNGIRILPKLLASEITIEIGDENGVNEKRIEKEGSKSKKVDLILIDDNEMFVDSLADLFIDRGKTVDKFYNPNRFLDKVSQYAKNTQIFIDNDLQSNISGIELAEQLHGKGYTKLYLLSGTDFKEEEIPSYLEVISKTDTDKLLGFVA